MAQSTDYVLSNQSGAAFRAELNTILAAIASQNSGATKPATTYAYMLWADESAGILKQRNAADNAWVDLLNLADGSVIDDSITTAKIADDAVTTAKILDANITQAKLATNVVGKGAAFSAHALVAQTVSSGVSTKANFATEEFDTSSSYDTALSRFTAPVNGYYQFYSSIRATGTSISQVAAQLFVNGANVQTISNLSASANISSSTSKIIFLTAGDFVEKYVSVTGTGTIQIGGTALNNTSVFSGILVRAA